MIPSAKYSKDLARAQRLSVYHLSYCVASFADVYKPRLDSARLD